MAAITVAWLVDKAVQDAGSRRLARSHVIDRLLVLFGLRDL
jgi:hypothetical protein